MRSIEKEEVCNVKKRREEKEKTKRGKGESKLQRERRRKEKRPRLELFRCHSLMRSARIRHLRRIGAHVGVAHAGEAIHKSSVKPL